MTGPEISIPKEARGYQGHAAGVVSRLVASTIDAAVVGVMLGGIYLGIVALTFLVDPVGFTWPDADFLVSLTVSLFLSTFYLFLCWWLFGRSYGGHVMGLRVVSGNGRRLGPLRCLLRAAFCVFFPIGLFWCAVSSHRRSLQDVVLWTRVVYDWMPRAGASQRKTLLGEAPMAMEPLPEGDERPEVVAAEEPHTPPRRHRWAQDDGNADTAEAPATADPAHPFHHRSAE